MTNSNNITPADRVGTVKEYYFSKKLREIAQLNAQGADIISLGIGGPDLPPSQAVIDTLCEQARLNNTHGYQPYIGIPELREAYAQWYSTTECPWTQHQRFCLSSARRRAYCT